MKKLFLLAGFYCLHPTTQAQSASSREISFSGKTVEYADHLINRRDLNAKEIIYARALRDFRFSYPGVQDETWTALPDKEISCLFRQPGMETRLYYGKHGRRRFSISRYGADHLNQDIGERIHNEYPGYHISNVNEIKVAGFPTSYILNLEVLDHIKVVRVVGDDMDELQEIEKP
jgi:hypothetical protein